MKKINLSLIIVLLLLISIIAFIGYRWGRSDRVAVQGFVECRTLRLASKIAGRIDKMFVEEGDSVRKGDTLYIISTPELDAKLSQVEAVLSGAKAAFREGMATATEVVDAVLNLSRARLERVQTAYEFDVALARLLEASGMAETFLQYLHGKTTQSVF